MKFRPWGKIYQLGLRYPLLVLLICSLLTVLSFLLARQLHIEVDFAALLPPQTESVKNLQDLKKYFGSVEHLIVTVEADDPIVAKTFAEEFAERIEKLPDVRYVDYSRTVEFFQDRKWLYVDLEDLKEMERRIDRSLELQKSGISPVFNHLMNFADEKNRPDLTFKDIRKKYEDRFGLKAIPYLAGQNGKFLILQVKAKQGAESLEFNRGLISNIKTIETNLRQNEKFKTIKVGYTGHYQSSIEAIDLIRKEVTLVSMAVFSILFLILFFYFGRFSGAFLVGFPLAMGVIWTGGFVYLILGHVNIITAFAISILAGLGSDYGIYLLSRFSKEKKAGKDFTKACYLTFNQTGRVALIAMLTTVGAFGALLFSGFQAFVEFGIVGGLGLALNYLAMMLVIPSCLKLAQNHSQNRFLNWLMGWHNIDKFGVSKQPLIFGKIFSTRWAGSIVILVLIIFGVSAFSVPYESQIHYEDGQIDNNKLPSSLHYQRVRQTLDSSLFPAVILLSDAKSEKKTVEVLTRHLKQSSSDSLVFDRILGLSSFVPNQQDKKREVLKGITIKFPKNKYIIGRQKEEFIKDIQLTLKSAKINHKGLPLQVTRNFISPIDPNYHAVYVFPSISRDDTEGMNRYRKGIYAAMTNSGVNFTPVDGSFISADVINMVIREAPRGFVMILAFLSVVLFFTLRQAKRTILIILHLMGSFLLISGVLYVTGVKLNILNIAVFPIILGTGIDCFIHLNQHFNETNNLKLAIKDEIPAILIANLTSIVGFGGLIFTSSVGLRSIGWVGVIGLTIITIICTVVFPRSLALVTSEKFKLFKMGPQKIPSPSVEEG